MALRLSRRARSDLDEIWTYIFVESGGEAVADRQIDLITGSLSLLEQWPLIGRTREELRVGLRSFPAGSYLIFYRVVRRDVHVLRILHARRDIASLLGGG